MMPGQVQNAQNVSPNKGKTFEVISFEDLYSKFFNANSIDFLMLKMDIEGGEEPILLRFPKTSNNIQMLGVEMDFLSLLPFSVSQRELSKSEMRDKICAIYRIRIFLRS
jgi:hypothetical protein